MINSFSFYLSAGQFWRTTTPGRISLVCCCLVTKLCLTLCDPMDYSPSGSSAHGISQARILEWVAISFSMDLPNPGLKPTYPVCQVDSLLFSHLAWFFNTLCILCHSLLACTPSNEKSADNLMGVHLYVRSYFSCFCLLTFILAL